MIFLFDVMRDLGLIGYNFTDLQGLPGKEVLLIKSNDWSELDPVHFSAFHQLWGSQTSAMLNLMVSR